MNIEGSVALVTGANRGLGHAYARELLAQGAAKVYAGVRDPATVTDPDLVPLRLDVTDPVQVRQAAEEAGDVTLLFNNAGVLTSTSPLDADAIDQAEHELQVNYFGPMRTARAFAPVLAENGGGALVNMLSVLSWIAFPNAGNYCASKAAAWSMTNSLRTQLRGQGTQVVGVHVGYVDTDMTAGVTDPKSHPADIARIVVQGIADGAEEILADDISRAVKSALSDDLNLLYPGVQERYDAAVAAA
jgi:NAD(P)-dependent dehydrogenase (short-subunit alcohol dehydrogenase family)